MNEYDIPLNTISLCSIFMSMSAITLSIYLLIDKNFNTKTKSHNMVISVYGLGWLVILMQSLSYITAGSFIGHLFFFISFYIWIHTELNFHENLRKIFKLDK